MIIRFGLELDRLFPSKPHSSFGRATVGPSTFLPILETQIGLPTPLAPPATRLVQYRTCLQKCDSPKRFFHNSFGIDDLSVSKTLLNWRDEWYMAGWDGTFTEGVSKRLEDMADVEVFAQKEVSLSIGQRLQAVLEALQNRKTQIEKIEIVDALSDFPTLWQKVLSRFEMVELNIDKRLPVSKKNTDLRKLQQALTDLNQKNSSKLEKVKLSGDGSVTILTARSKEVSARILAEHIKSTTKNPIWP